CCQLGQPFRLRNFVRRIGHPPAYLALGITSCRPAIGSREFWIEFDCHIEVRQGFIVCFFGPLMNRYKAPQVVVVGVKSVSRLSPGSLDFHLLQLRSNCADDVRGQLILQIENVLESTVKTVCPEVNACRGLNELSRDANTARSSAQTSFEHVTHA